MAASGDQLRNDLKNEMKERTNQMKTDAKARKEAERAAMESSKAEIWQKYDGSISPENVTNVTLAPNRTAPEMPEVDTDEMVSQFVDTLQMVLEVMYGAVLGIQNIPMLVPAVLSMVTGMLKASLAVKILVPGSSLPGVFIIVLPLVTTPIFWAIFNVIFQIVGGLDLLLGLMLLAFLPCLNTIVGAS